MADAVEIRPYAWEGPYADMRSSANIPHDAGLCADIRAEWMEPGGRIILRSSEIVGYEDAYLYDDHFPPCEPEGRGKGYEHISFRWNAQRAPRALSAACDVAGRGSFSLDLVAEADAINITLAVGSHLDTPMGDIDWHFCAVGYEAPSVGDVTLQRTYIFDGERLRTLAEMSGGAKCEMYKVAGAGGFLPVIHRDFPAGPVEAKASCVIVESADKTHAVALGFERSYVIFSNPPNMCFHADPYFGPITKKEEVRTVRGMMYLMAGTAEDAFERYRADFGQ